MVLPPSSPSPVELPYEVELMWVEELTWVEGVTLGPAELPPLRLPVEEDSLLEL